MHITNIEKFFLNTILRISLAGVAVILITDLVFFPEDTISISIDITILVACSIAYAIRSRFPTTSVLTIIVIVLLAMVYQCLHVPANTTTSMAIILILGFIGSVMLKGKILISTNTVVFLTMNALFTIQFIDPTLRFTQKMNEMVTVAITYSILFAIVTYASWMLKSSYDRIHHYLIETNGELNQKATEIASQNEELLKMHNNLNAMNAHLEQIVDERTIKIQQQNEILYKYSYANAHHLRGPVARLLGLVNIYGLHPKPDPDFIIEKMADQANEIDAVVKQINIDLDTNTLMQPKGLNGIPSIQKKS
jgi:signal transduction histidine kinase